MIKIEALTKTFGNKTAVDALTLNLQSGLITGLLGPNGSGKSTTMKMIVSLVQPTSGKVLIDGKSYKEIEAPFKRIGTMIDPDVLDGNLTAHQHLSIIATAADIPLKKVDDMLGKTGLSEVKKQRIKTFSLGMKQRLGIATALLSEPDAVILDEPFNGLDVDGIKWLRRLFRSLADEGKAVVVSSHLMGEIQAVADRVAILGRGKLLADMSMDEMKRYSMNTHVIVDSSDNQKLEQKLLEKDANTAPAKVGLEVRHMDAQTIGQLANQNDIPLHQLTTMQPSLEDLFVEITGDKVDYQSKGGDAREAD